MKHILITPLLFCTIILNSQSPLPVPNDFGFMEYTIHDNELGTILFFVSKKNINKRKPLLIFEQGSGGYPSVFNVHFPDTTEMIPFIITKEYQIMQEDFHYVNIAKPGTPFSMEVTLTNYDFMHFLEHFKPSKEYEEELTLDWRVKASSKVIDYMCDHFQIDTSKIIVWGGSEGASVTPALANYNKKVTHVVSMNGSGLNELLAPIINIRNDEIKGAISGDEAQNQINDLFKQYKDIYQNPEATDKYWYNHVYKRWGSFAGAIDAENYLKLDIPIYILGGSRDRNTPILNFDYLQLEFIRSGKSNLTYDVCINCDHWLNEKVIEDGKEKTISHKEDYIRKILIWINNN